MSAVRRPNRAGGVVFDVDGVLLDTEPLYTAATQAIVGRWGKRYEPELKARMMGQSSAVGARMLVAELGLPLEPEEYLALRRPALEALFADAPALPGARELVADLLACGIPVALATSAERALHERKAARHAWLRDLPVVICGDDAAAGRPKPAPDIFLAAASGLARAPASCVAIEDSLAGVEAAAAAGMAVVAVPDVAMAHLPFRGASLVLDSLEALRRLWFAAP
ncbi:MAG: HAD-IA family hydrolase [Polyangiaceae bacterium]|nr:HAD-IA family hydrolase [Polyangiaceae bacterium]